MKKLSVIFTAAVLLSTAVSAGSLSADGIRLKLNLTNAIKVTKTVPLALVTPAMASNIGPGSHLLIEMDGGTFGCTANFVWQSGATRYLGAAGHCFVPEGLTATHGPGADWNASGVRVSVCVSNCSFGGQSGFVVTGNMVVLGSVAYARQTAADGDVGARRLFSGQPIRRFTGLAPVDSGPSAGTCPRDQGSAGSGGVGCGYRPDYRQPREKANGLVIAPLPVDERGTTIRPQIARPSWPRQLNNCRPARNAGARLSAPIPSASRRSRRTDT